MPRFPAGNGPPDFQGVWTTCLSRFINHHCTLQFLRWSEDSSVFFLWGDLWIVKMKVKTSQLTLACIYKYIIIYIYFYVNIYTCWIYPPPRMQSWQMSRSRLESSTKTCNNPGGEYYWKGDQPNIHIHGWYSMYYSGRILLRSSRDRCWCTVDCFHLLSSMTGKPSLCLTRTHTVHVWHIYLHLDFLENVVNIPYMDPTEKGLHKNTCDATW